MDKEIVDSERFLVKMARDEVLQKRELESWNLMCSLNTNGTIFLNKFLEMNLEDEREATGLKICSKTKSFNFNGQYN